ncbi:hypothetical protein IQ250_07465 [Pseudanabaenaceae cyanobacterium LEGE 13415]|nr:hypothetical protein [Pseudanabaenaceae cyanobacterium LEGE 13415]
MSTFFRMALTATLALSVSFSLVGLKGVRAEISEMADALTARQVKDPLTFALRSDTESQVEQRISTFDPEPNDPPRRTGGSGTR